MTAFAPVTDLDIPVAEMAKRLARFKELKSSSKAFIDTSVPGHERDIYSIIGSSTFEDPDLRPKIAAQEVHIGIVKCEPGKGAALHSHLTEEIFMPLDGTWSVFWGPRGENELILEQWDIISVPIHVMRGFRNIGDTTAHIMAIVGGRDPGKVGWPEHMLNQARAGGVTRNADGRLTKD